MSEETLPKYKNLLTAIEAANLYDWAKFAGFEIKMASIFSQIRENTILGKRQIEIFGDLDILHVISAELHNYGYNAYVDNNVLFIKW